PPLGRGGLPERFAQPDLNCQDLPMNRHEGRRVVPLEDLRMTDVDSVGGKNASLGEMISQLASSHVRVPGGFATTAFAFREFLLHEGLAERIAAQLEALNVEDVKALVETGERIRRWIVEAPLPEALERDIREHYRRMVEAGGGAPISVAVRS